MLVRLEIHSGVDAQRFQDQVYEDFQDNSYEYIQDQVYEDFKMEYARTPIFSF
jgi:hypothetical protein